MPLILGANSVSGYTVKNSLRFNSGSSDRLNRTLGTATNSKLFTFSTWFKLSKLSTERDIIRNYVDGDNRGYFHLETGDTLFIFIRGGATDQLQWRSTQLFRDVSAWYHLVIKADSTQSSQDDRFKVYLNGSEITAWTKTTQPSQNIDWGFNKNSATSYIGSTQTPSEYFDGYMADTYFIDGQALTPSSFGETDTLSGIWIPKAYTGTYGTNGFFLKFSNSASLGTDSSGNGNNFTVNNLTSVDQSTDTPTNNFCTFNPLDKNSSITTSEGNLKITGTSDCKTTIGVSKGKWYCETKITAIGATVLTGITFSSVDGSNHTAVDAKRIIYQDTGYIYREATGNAGVNTGTTFTTGDIIGLALDCDNGTIKFYKNGTLIHTETNSVISGNEQMFYTYLGSSATAEMNFGSPSYSANSYTDGAGYGNFSYAVPSGYYALCTKNLANYG